LDLSGAKPHAHIQAQPEDPKVKSQSLYYIILEADGGIISKLFGAKIYILPHTKNLHYNKA